MGAVFNPKAPAVTQMQPLTVKPKGVDPNRGAAGRAARARAATAGAGKGRFRVDTDPDLQTPVGRGGLHIPNSVGPR